MSAITQRMPQVPLTALDKNHSLVSQADITLATTLPELKSQLSNNAKIILPNDVEFEARTQRFSDYKKPMPGAVVCPVTEKDLAATVKWATSNDIKFLARAGGHGWSMTLSAIGPEGILINLRDMNKINVDLEAGIATLGAGATTGELLRAAQNADAHIVAAACDSVGAVPSIMGGGIGNVVSNYGLACDNIVSARLVTSTGSVVNASATENADLFWAVRGAGHNFGIVSELTVKAYPQINNGQHWSGMLGFPGSAEVAKKVCQTIEEMGVTEGKAPEGISCTMVYGRPHSVCEPTVLLKLSFNGSTADAMSAFAPLYSLADNYKPNINEGQLMPADEINEAKDSLCTDGGSFPQAYRPVHSASLESVDIDLMGALYERWEEYTRKNEDTKQTVLRVNFYDYRHVRKISVEESAFAWRKNPINVLQHWVYTDKDMDSEIQSLGHEFRNALNGSQTPNVVVSFASGDENPSHIYGDGLQRIREVKNKWDPMGVFSYYNSC